MASIWRIVSLHSYGGVNNARPRLPQKNPSSPNHSKNFLRASPPASRRLPRPGLADKGRSSTFVSRISHQWCDAREMPTQGRM
jgi:hypothetical protein